MTQANKKTVKPEPLDVRLTKAHNILINAKIPGIATAEVFAGWLREHKNKVFWIIIKDDEGENRGILYFKKPGRNDINYAHTKQNPNAQDEMYIALAEVMFIGGMESLLKDEDAMMTICDIVRKVDYGAAALVGGNL